jgi:undecaprenyl-diphosphatase
MAIRSTVDPTVSEAVSPPAGPGAHAPADREDRPPAREPLFEPTADGPADTLGARLSTTSPVRAALVVLLASYAVLSALLIGVGMMLTRVLFPDHPARWDLGTNRFLADHRTHALNGATWVGSHLAETATVVGVAAIVVLVLLWRHRPLAAGFLASALVIEVTAFLTATLVIDRARPAVARLDGAPPTSSYPSGHSAAAVALYFGLALIVTSLGRSRVFHTVIWTLAVAVPLFVGFSRLYRGMHFPTDVLAGLLLGAGALAAAMLVVRTGVAVSHRHARRQEAAA